MHRLIEASLTNFSSMAGIVPVYGPRLAVAMRLSMLAVDVSQTGISGCQLLEKILDRMGSPLTCNYSWADEYRFHNTFS